MITLYHGSNVEVMTPRIQPLVRALDFGRAFYMTSSLEQAAKWARTSTLRREEGVPTVSVFAFKTDLALAYVRFVESSRGRFRRDGS